MSDENDEELWSLMTRDVDKIEHMKPLTPEPKEKPRAKTQKRTVKKPNSETLPLQRTAAAAPSREVDRSTAEKLRKGQIPLEGRLDLHGMRQGEAYEALNNFIIGAQGAGKRCVLIITGKGAGADGRRDPLSQGQGVLKRMVPEWLGQSPLAEIVLRAQKARPQHGGEGALYVLLRRRR